MSTDDLVEAGPGQQTIAEITLPERAVSIWDDSLGWQRKGGDYLVHAGRSYTDLPLTAALCCPSR